MDKSAKQTTEDIIAKLSDETKQNIRDAITYNDKVMACIGAKPGKKLTKAQKALAAEFTQRYVDDIPINVIIPCYNGNATLRGALLSLVAQTVDNFAVTIVDDGSTEDIMPIVDEFTPHLFISVIRHKENQGVAQARQTGLDNNGYPYVCFLDADDAFDPNAIKYFTEVIFEYYKDNGHPVELIYSAFTQETDGGKKRYEIMGDRAITWFHGKCYNAEFLARYNIRLHADVRTCEDAQFNTLAFTYAQDVYYIELPAYTWRNNKDSITRGTADFTAKAIPDFVLGLNAAACNLICHNRLYDSKIFAASLGVVYDYYCQIAKRRNGDNRELFERAEANIRELFQNIRISEYRKQRGLISIAKREVRKARKERKANRERNPYYISFEQFLDRFSEVEV